MQAEIGCGMRIRARVPASIRDGRNADQVDLAGDAGSELGLRWIGDQDNPLVPLHRRMRAFDRDLIRGGIMASGHVNRT